MTELILTMAGLAIICLYMEYSEYKRKKKRKSEAATDSSLNKYEIFAQAYADSRNAEDKMHRDELSNIEEPELRPGEMKEVGKTKEGYTIFVQENGVGGHRYFSNEIGGGVFVWDTSLVSPESLLFAIENNKQHR